MKQFSTWKWLVIVGTLLIIGAINCFLNPFYSYIKLVGYSGILFLIHGLFLSFVSNTKGKNKVEKNWLWVESLLHFIIGSFLLFNPIFSFFLFPIILGVWVSLLGIIKLMAAILLRNSLFGWRSITGIGACLLLFGLVILLYPFGKAEHLTFLIGFFGLLMGALYLIDAYRYRYWHETLELML